MINYLFLSLGEILDYIKENLSESLGVLIEDTEGKRESYSINFVN